MFGPHTLSRSPKAQNESHSQSMPTLHGRTVEDASHAPQGVNLPTRRQPLGDRKVAVPKVRRARRPNFAVTLLLASWVEAGE